MAWNPRPNSSPNRRRAATVGSGAPARIAPTALAWASRAPVFSEIISQQSATDTLARPSSDMSRDCPAIMAAVARAKSAAAAARAGVATSSSTSNARAMTASPTMMAWSVP